MTKGKEKSETSNYDHFDPANKYVSLWVNRFKSMLDEVVSCDCSL